MTQGANQVATWAKNNPDFRGVITNKDTGLSMNISSVILNEMEYHTPKYKDIDSIRAIPAIPELLKNAIYYDTETNKHDKPDVPWVHLFYAPLKIGNASYLAKLKVREVKQGKQPYFLEAIELTKTTNPAHGWANALSVSKWVDGSVTVSVADVISAVNVANNSASIQPSKVVDNNGKPLVVYHGTEKPGFTIFDTSPKNQFGAHFTPNQSMAKEFTGATGGVYAAYLSIKNPLDIVSDLGDWTDIDMWKEYLGPENYEIATDEKLSNINTVQDVKELLVSKGYDGVKYQNSFEGNTSTDMGDVAQDVYIVFEPEQIKSATENIGTFNGTNPDIRYSVQNLIDDGSLNPVTRATIRKAFPGATIKQIGELEWYEVTMPNGQMVTVQFVDEIQPTDIDQTNSDYKLVNPSVFTVGNFHIAGVFFPVDVYSGIIEISSIGGETTLYHESFHAAMYMALTPRERKAVLDNYGEKKAQYTNDEVRAKEEVAAKAFEEWKRKHAGKRKPTSMIERLWQKIYDMALAIKDAFIVNEEAVFRKISNGSVWKRKPSSNTRMRNHDAWVDKGMYSVQPTNKTIEATFNKVILKPMKRNGQLVFSKDAEKTIRVLTKRGWNRTDNRDGSIVFSRPANEQQAPAPQQQQSPAQQQSVPQQPGQIRFSNEETESRFKKANKIPEKSIREKLRDAIDYIFAGFTREYIHLPRTMQFAELRNYLQKLQHQKGVATDVVTRSLKSITDALKDRSDYDLFTRKVLMDDLEAELELNENYELPFSWTKDTFETDKTMIDNAVNNNPRIQQALQARKTIWDQINKEYSESMKDIGFNVEDRISKKNYFRHIVLEYAAVRDELKLTPIVGQNNIKTPTSRGFLKAREGSNLDILADYLQPEFEVMGQMLYDIQIAKTIKMVDKKYNIIDQLKKAALSENDTAMFNTLLDTTGNPLDAIKAYNKLGWKQALAIQRLEEMAAGDELPTGPGGMYESIIDALSDAYNERMAMRNRSAEQEPEARNATSRLSGNDMKGLFSYVNWLLKTEGNVTGKSEAALLFKGMAEKKKAMKDTLGDDFKTWERMIPEGYTTWQPQKGNMFYTGFTIPEQLANAIAQSALADFGIPENVMRRAVVLGGRRSSYVVPKEVAATLDEMQTQTSLSLLRRLGRPFHRTWKRYVLHFPTRIIRYTIGNLFGDLDGMIAGNQGGFKYMKRSAKELKDLFYGSGEMTPDMKDWFERGGMQTLQNVSELGDVNQLEFFERFKDDETTAEKIVGVPIKIWKGYWSKAREFNDFREAIMRYANYLSYLEQMENNDGTPNNYGSSIREEIHGIEDIKDRAFKLSNELLGAYDALSVFGQEARDTLVPFWSWNEVNARRYIMLFRNAYIDGKVAGAIGEKILGLSARKAPAIAVFIGKTFFKAALMWGLLSAYNMIVFGDEEDDLPEEIRGKPHIILGRDADGKVRYIDRLGAFSDFLDWVGSAGLPMIFRDLYLGRKTMAEIGSEMWKDPVNKIVNGLTPLAKTPFELMAMKKIFPDATNPRTFHDRTQYLFDFFALGNEFKAFSRTNVGKSIGFDPRPSKEFSIPVHIASMFYKSSEPDANAYYYMIDQKHKFLEKQGKKNDGSFYNVKSNTLRMYKQAVRYNDPDTAAYYLAQYKLLGGTKDGLVRSLQAMEPLSGLNKEQKKLFIDSLNSEQRSQLAKANLYYQKTLADTGVNMKDKKKW